MRYINCARYFEEQNIVSEQDGIDIFFETIKVSDPILSYNLLALTFRDLSWTPAHPPVPLVCFVFLQFEWPKYSVCGK